MKFLFSPLTSIALVLVSSLLLVSSTPSPQAIQRRDSNGNIYSDSYVPPGYVQPSSSSPSYYYSAATSSNNNDQDADDVPPQVASALRAFARIFVGLRRSASGGPPDPHVTSTVRVQINAYLREHHLKPFIFDQFVKKVSSGHDGYIVDHDSGDLGIIAV